MVTCKHLLIGNLAFDAKFLAGAFIQSLPGEIRRGISASGIRNSHLTAIAPTGTISLLANNISSSPEPVFDLDYCRRVLEVDGSYETYPLTDYAVRLWRELRGEKAPLPAAFADARKLPPEAHLDMQAALQPYVATPSRRPSTSQKTMTSRRSVPSTTSRTRKA